MILQQEFLRIAGALEVDPEIVELDYVLGRFLDALTDCLSISDRWIFKGGTLLRKCYFDGYRFSEDLDFTLSSDEEAAIERVLRCGTGTLSRYSDYQIRLVMPTSETKGGRAEEVSPSESPSATQPRDSVADDDVGTEDELALEARVYYASLLGLRNERRISVHLSWDEIVIIEPNRLPLIHPFGDGPTLGKITCYSLDEVLAEKLRAVAGQRKYAIARDIFDISEILRRGHPPGEAVRIFPEKCKRKRLEVGKGAYDRLLARKQEYAASWRGSLEHLLPAGLRREGFEAAWSRAADLLQCAVESTNL